MNVSARDIKRGNVDLSLYFTGSLSSDFLGAEIFRMDLDYDDGSPEAA